MDQVRHRRGSAVALVAALVLVLQSFLGAWATGALAATPMLDAFGNPLCITSAGHDGTTPAGDHSTMLDCCVFGCSMASPWLAAAPESGVGLLQLLSSDDLRFGGAESFLIRGPDHDPGNPRAPPPTV